MKEKVENSLALLRKWCEKEHFRGWDPYDGLNSRIFQSLPFLKDSEYARLAWIQAFRRLPVNLRSVAAVPKGLNPKGIALFLTGYVRLYKMKPDPALMDTIRLLTDMLIGMQSKNYSGACWGYNFDWQARAFYQPSGTPTIVASSFIGCALLDSFAVLRDEHALNIARSVADFFRNDLHKTYDSHGNFAYSYSPLDRTTVYNASLLGARLLARLYSLTGEAWLAEEAAGATRFCISGQNQDGSWYYSPLPHHQWIDNFHTGFNLECLSDYMLFTGDMSPVTAVQKGFQFWISNFFTADGIPKYYHDSIYPIDLHATAELVIAAAKCGKFKEAADTIDRVLAWSIDNMQSAKGYFHYRKNPWITIRIPYMRWTQAWMFAALAEYLYQTSTNEPDRQKN